LSHEILNSIDEYVILANTEGDIHWVNQKAKLLVKREDGRENKDLSNIIQEAEEVKRNIKEMLEGKFKDFSSRIHFYKEGYSKFILDMKFSIVKDKFKDIVGILIIGKEVKNIRQLKEVYNITDREANVIQLVFNGCSNMQIAESFEITERTVKAHLTNIYHKLHVDNKIGLVNFLIDYNLVSSQEAERRLISF
jgi:DNA-binding CsgD family transcriptional regulator